MRICDLGKYPYIISILHRGEFLNLLQYYMGGGLPNLLQYYNRGGGVYRDPKVVLRNKWTAPKAAEAAFKTKSLCNIFLGHRYGLPGLEDAETFVKREVSYTVGASEGLSLHPSTLLVYMSLTSCCVIDNPFLCTTSFILSM